MLTSVVIPAYNAAATLAETLDSVLAQSEGRWEALVVDDGSADATGEIARGYAGRDRRVRLLGMDRNRGVSAARNHGISQARGDLVAFLDADDAYLPHAIAALGRALADAPGAAVAYGMAEEMGGTGERRLGSGAPGIPVGLFAQLARFNVVATSATAVRRGALRPPAFPLGLPFQFEDWACWLDLSRRHAFLFVPNVVTRYRAAPAGATARVAAEGRQAEFAAAMGRHLRSSARAFSPPERSIAVSGLVSRATEAVLAALHHARRGRPGAAAGWLRAAVAIAGSPSILARAALGVGPEWRRMRRGTDPSLTFLPAPPPDGKG